MSHGGRMVTVPLLDADTTGCGSPRRQTLLDADPPKADPPGHVTCDACWEATPLWTEGMIHACENITLPQTSFAGGNKGSVKG